MRGVHLKTKLKYTENGGVVAGWLLHCDQYVRQYYSECYNRDVQVHNLENHRIVGFCREDFNLAIGSIRDIKIRDHFIRDILYLMLY